MKIPKSLNVLGHKIKVVIKDLGGEHNGWYHPDTNLIEIHVDVAGTKKDVAFLHEALHAVHDKASLSQSIPVGVEEIVVDQTASTLVKNFVMIAKEYGDTIVKHYAIYSAYGDLKCFHTDKSLASATIADGDLVVELVGTVKFKRKRKLLKINA